MSEKRKIGDRKDGKLLKNLDSMHFIVPMLYPNRCDNEAFITERIDLTNVNIYLNNKNSANPEYNYNIFQLIVTAMLKTITLRPKMNRFIANKNFYQRNEVSAAFVVKKQFTDNAGEALAFIHSKETDTLESVHNEIYRQVSSCRRDDFTDGSTKSMDTFNKIPRTIAKFLVSIVRILDRYGKVPASLIETDPYYSSVVLSNLGSIKIHSGYHHLTNWGTNSVFVAIGEKKMRPFFAEDGTVSMRDSIDIGLTIDERLADGYYYSKSVRLFKKLLENPELLELPLNEKVEY